MKGNNLGSDFSSVKKEVFVVIILMLCWSEAIEIIFNQHFSAESAH
jgi:hypothetical protein